VWARMNFWYIHEFAVSVLTQIDTLKEFSESHRFLWGPAIIQYSHPDCYILRFFPNLRPKTLLNPKIFPDCYTFLIFFCNSPESGPGESTVHQLFVLSYIVGDQLSVYNRFHVFHEFHVFVCSISHLCGRANLQIEIF